MKISKVSKLDGILSWSLQAKETCPGSIGKDGKLVDACSGCYATTGNYNYPNVKAPRQHNKEDWKRDAWIDDMVMALNSQRYFRWLDSGDIYSLKLAEKVLEVMKRTPWVKHWLPTRMAKFSKFQSVIQQMMELDNVAVRFSSDSVIGEFQPGVHGSVIFPADTTEPAGTFKCRAYEAAGKCNGCRACYDKSVPVIAYPSHGRKMTKVIMLKKA